MTQAITLKDNEDAFFPIVIASTGSGFRLDDYNLEMHIRRTATDTDILVTATDTNGRISIVDPVTGEIEVFLARSVVRNTLGPGVCYFDIALTEKVTGYVESTPLAKITVTRGITQPTP